MPARDYSPQYEPGRGKPEEFVVSPSVGFLKPADAHVVLLIKSHHNFIGFTPWRAAQLAGHLLLLALWGAGLNLLGIKPKGVKE